MIKKRSLLGKISVFALMGMFFLTIFTLNVKAADYEINSIEDLVAFREAVNGDFSYGYTNKDNYKLMVDLDLTEYLSEGGAGYNNGYGWIPIGVVTRRYSGIFDGNGHEIRGLFIDNNSQLLHTNPNGGEYHTSTSGLFGDLGSTAEVKNLTVSGTIYRRNISADGYSMSVGGIAGECLGKITNCTSNVNIYNESTGTYAKATGGIVGYISATSASATPTISNCTYNGTIESKIQVGGIVGYTVTFTGWLAPKILNCTNNGNITGDGIAGGIVGNNTSTAIITGCINNGNITGVSNVGGIAGTTAKGITTSTNNGNIIGTSYVGGIAGTASSGQDSNITSVFNYGSVNGTDKVGGLVGKAETNTFEIKESYNFGDVTNTGSYTGGILGYYYSGSNTATITSTLNDGEINGTDYTGGIAGSIKGKIISSQNNGLINGTTKVAGIATAATEVYNSFNTGAVIAQSGQVAGIVADSSNPKITNCYNYSLVGSKSDIAIKVGYLSDNTANIIDSYYTEVSNENENVLSIAKYSVGSSSVSSGGFAAGSDGSETRKLNLNQMYGANAISTTNMDFKDVTINSVINTVSSIWYIGSEEYCDDAHNYNFLPQLKFLATNEKTDIVNISKASTQVKVDATHNDQTSDLVAPITTTYSYDVVQEATIVVTGGNGTGTITYSIIGGTGKGTITNGLLEITKPGTFLIKAIKNGDLTYNSQSINFYITFTGYIDQPALVAPTTTTYDYSDSDEITLGVTGGDEDKEVVYEITGGTGIGSITNGILVVTRPGTFNITAVKNKDDNYGYNKVQISFTITVNGLANQPDLITPETTTYDYSNSDEIILNVLGGDTSKEATYEITGGSGKGSIVDGKLVVTKPGTFIIKATKEGDDTTGYNEANLTFTITVNGLANQPDLITPETTTYDYSNNNEIILNVLGGDTSKETTYEITGGSGKGSIVDGKLVVTKPGTFIIKATKEGDDTIGYNEANLTFTITVNGYIEQPTLVAPTTLSYDYATSNTITLSVTGGAEGKEIIYTIIGGTGIGTISNNILTITTAGTFIIKATKEADLNFGYSEANVSFTITINSDITPNPSDNNNNNNESNIVGKVFLVIGIILLILLIIYGVGYITFPYYEKKISTSIKAFLLIIFFKRKKDENKEDTTKDKEEK